MRLRENMPQHSYVTIAVKSYKNVKYKASFICCRLWASVMHAPISYKKNSWLHDDSSMRIARLRWWQFKTQELDNFKRACGSSCTCCILVRANETTETERNGIDACGKKRHWRLRKETTLTLAERNDIDACGKKRHWRLRKETTLTLAVARDTRLLHAKERQLFLHDI